MKIDLLPFTVPNYVIAKTAPGNRADGWVDAPKWHIRDVDTETLSELCDQFRADVFAKAGKSDPARAALEGK